VPPAGTDHNYRLQLRRRDFRRTFLHRTFIVEITRLFRI
jgi:hypothetical protein